jgi:hypothetical protein
MPHPVHSDFLRQSKAVFRMYKDLGDKAMAQLADDADIFRTLDPESNSVAIIVKHLRGNMRSRWTDFLTSDGEKPDRHRDEEFEMREGLGRADVLRWWEEGWSVLFAALDGLTEDDLGRTVTIRGEPHTVVQAIQRQVAHYASHVGQIVLLAKHLRSSEWKTLSIPRGKSEEYLRRTEAKFRA